jgi:hypothetical protein
VDVASANPSSLSDLKHRSENSPARGQILIVLQRQYRDIAQKTGEICTGPADLQPMLFKSDRLPVFARKSLSPKEIFLKPNATYAQRRVFASAMPE